MAIIDIQNLEYAYDDEAVLEEVNLPVRQGDFTAIIGPNGGGKTTLLKLTLGLLTPDRGTVRIDGRSPQKASRCIGYLPQNVDENRSFPITTMDVVLMGKLNPKKRLSRNTNTQRRDALAALERLEVADFADRKIGTLSGGQPCHQAPCRYDHRGHMGARNGLWYHFDRHVTRV